MAKFKLTMSLGWLKHWTVADAVREIMQNAIDNETEAGQPTMYWYYDRSEEKIVIGNKSTGLAVKTLLLGATTKSENDNLIGKYGEGYKGAILVLLRAGKKVNIYNYGARQIWGCRLVNSRTYGDTVPEIESKNLSIFSKEKSDSLEFEITGITGDDFEEIKSRILQMQENYGKIDIDGTGCTILTDEQHAGKVYVEGLYVADKSSEGLLYGYNFSANLIKLDRDRRMMDSVNLGINTSQLWARQQGYDDLMRELLDRNSLDVKFIGSIREYYGKTITKRLSELGVTLYQEFKESHGVLAVPVSTETEAEEARANALTPVIVTGAQAKLMRPYVVEGFKNVGELTFKQQLFIWFTELCSETYVPASFEKRFKDIMATMP